MKNGFLSQLFVLTGVLIAILTACLLGWILYHRLCLSFDTVPSGGSVKQPGLQLAARAFGLSEPMQYRRTKAVSNTKKWHCLAWSLVLLPGLAFAKPEDSEDVPENARVADLQVVDCLLPGMVRRLGNMQYLSPRRPVRTTAADCRIRGGEYTEYDRADYKTALQVWMPAAEAGDAEAQANVGEIYERGLGGEPNYEAAAIWYERAAEQGNSRAQFNLGTLYEQGFGVEKNRLLALNWYRRAWGIPEDSLVYQSMANHEAEEARAELQKAIAVRDSRITRLQADLQELEKTHQAQAGQLAELSSHTASVAAEDTAVEDTLRAEIQDLRLWIEALESERSVSMQQLAALPKTRASEEENQVSRRTIPGRSITAGDLDFGRYFALVIGNQDYAKIDDLDTPENDATRVADLLQRKYGFAVEVLLNANNIEVMERINDLSERLDENDNLLIYYAGHGARIRAGDVESGYWLPVNADAPPRNTYWVSNEFVTGHLSRIPARRVMIVADSCYAGLLSDAPSYLMLEGAPEYTDEFMQYKLPKRSRLLLSSGGDRPVLDNGAPENSVFAAVLLETLEANEGILSGPQLYAAIDEQVRQRSAANGFDQSAEYKVIKGAGHEVGDFFFVPNGLR